MSRIQDPHKAFFPLGNPFRNILPKGSSLSPKLLALLNKFEEKLAQRLIKLKPKNKDDVFSLSWMVLAMQLLSDTHEDIKSLITELELPVNDWDDKWIDVYLDNSIKLLDICISLSSELSRLGQGKLLLHCVLQYLEGKNPDELPKAKSSIDTWREHIAAGNARLANCFLIVDKLTESLELPKVKNSGKGKVLMRAMYGVKMETVFVCSFFLSAFTGSDKKLSNLQVVGTPLWADAFNDLQTFVYGEIRNLKSSSRNALLNELEEVNGTVEELYLLIQEDKVHVEAEVLWNSNAKLRNRVDQLSSGLDLLAKEADGFFQIVLSGRDALLCKLRVPTSVCDSPKKYKREEQPVR